MAVVGPDPAPPAPSPQLPQLPAPVAPEELGTLDAAGLATLTETLAGAERAVVAAMAPFDRLLREVRTRKGELATELRRRERAAHIAQRSAVRAAAGSGAMPTLADVLAGGGPQPDAPLGSLRVFLASGGAVGLGFATRPGTVAFTDGRRTRQATTLAEARELWAQGWEPGAPGVPGVRTHLEGSRVERVVPADGVVVDVGAGAED